jgi:hypothetical protein
LACCVVTACLDWQDYTSWHKKTLPARDLTGF